MLQKSGEAHELGYANSHLPLTVGMVKINIPKTGKTSTGNVIYCRYFDCKFQESYTSNIGIDMFLMIKVGAIPISNMDSGAIH